MQKTSTQIVKVAEFIKKANKILITAGAGSNKYI